MTASQYPSIGQSQPEGHVHDQTLVPGQMRPDADVGGGLGGRLRATREAKGLELAACAHTLRLPLHVLQQLEANRFDGIDCEVYLGGYIAKYARYLGIDEATIQSVLAGFKRKQPELIATGGISHSRYLLERYATAATYVVLTAVLVVPLVWLGVRGTLERDASRLAPLDAAPVAQQEVAAHASDGIATAAPKSALVKPAPIFGQEGDQQSLMASMAPFPSLGASVARTRAVDISSAASESALGSGQHALTLALDNTSWVEVIAHDGTRLEYGLLQAGVRKTYRTDQPLDVRIGNANGAQAVLDGQSLSLDGYRHANVAHFRVNVADGKAAAAAY